MRTALAHNVESFFSGLEFEEISHRYSLGSKPISISVSKIVEKFIDLINIQNSRIFL